MLTKDPVCGMTVQSLTAPAQRVHGGKTYSFCAKGCAEAFEKEPEKYLKSRAAVAMPSPSFAKASSFTKASEDRSEGKPRRKQAPLFEVQTPKPKFHPPPPVPTPKSKIQ